MTPHRPQNQPSHPTPISSSPRNELGGNLAPASAASISSSSSPTHRQQASARPVLTEADILEHAYGIPSLPVPSGSMRGGMSLTSKSDSRPHTRSLSNPFPSLFPGKKKQQQQQQQQQSPQIDEGPNSIPTLQHTTKDGRRAPLKYDPKHEPSGSGSPRSHTFNGNDLMTGKCMTCASTVRWPRALHVFRCTICLTVNDLVPIIRVQGPPTDGNKNTSGSTPLNRPPPLSVDKATALIQSCISDYITENLETLTHELPLQQHKSAEIYPGGGTLKDKDVAPPEKVREEANLKLGHPFSLLEEYLLSSFSSFECINGSFITLRPEGASNGTSESIQGGQAASKDEEPVGGSSSSKANPPKISRDITPSDFSRSRGRLNARSPGQASEAQNAEPATGFSGFVTLISPRLDWAELRKWYQIILTAGQSWRQTFDAQARSFSNSPIDDILERMEREFIEAQSHVHKTLLKATENLLKRPGRPLMDPDDLRFLIIILSNPLLYPSRSKPRSTSTSRNPSPYNQKERSSLKNEDPEISNRSKPPPVLAADKVGKGSTGQHSGIIKRIFGLLSNSSNDCHHHLVSWFSRFSYGQFHRTVDLVGSFVTYRLTRQQGKKQEVNEDPSAGLVPTIAGSGRNASLALRAALGPGSSLSPSTKTDAKTKTVTYSDDWQIRAAARVMSLLFSANSSGRQFLSISEARHRSQPGCERAYKSGKILSTSDFYNTLLDYSDLIADFESWEARRGRFTFCQYPFFLSIWAKIQIMEHDAKRQMEVKAREAFWDSIMTHKSLNQYLILKVRRECLVEDSLNEIGAAVGTGGEEIKKGLRIEFKGEEGIDAGGLRKEWFLLLVRDLFNPEQGMFTYDEDSHLCFFSPNSFETTDQYYLVGVVLGLAVYTSSILDVALPPFAFRKLLAASPVTSHGVASHVKVHMSYSLEDLAEYRPALANGLRQLLEFEGDVESTFSRDFVADVDKYGQVVQIPLCPNGENMPVTNANRREFVDLYVKYLLDTSVARQFEPFKRGFFTVCGGNALSLFRPEEIELLIRGSDEPLDIETIYAVSKCENWGVPNAKDTEPAVSWFWESFQAATPADQRKLLSFITGSDRIPAMGAASLVIKLSCLGDDSPRYPVARTCFNQLSLWRYSSREKLEVMLWRAVNESEGFGLK